MPREGHWWWTHRALASRMRRFFQKPEGILAPCVTPGMVCVEVGCGAGFFTVPMARMVGPRGRVYAVDVEPRVLEALTRRAERAGVAGRVRAVLCPAEELALDDRADFALAVWSMHELDDLALGVARIRECLKPAGRFLLAEPKWHVRRAQYEQSVRTVEDGGFARCDGPAVPLSRAALFQKSP